MKCLKNNKSSDHDDILNEYIKYSSHDMKTVIHKLFNIVLNCGFFPNEWTLDIINPIYKNEADATNMIIVGLQQLCCLGKLFTNIFNIRLQTYSEKK